MGASPSGRCRTVPCTYEPPVRLMNGVRPNRLTGWRRPSTG
jgi:hypothetical protein